MNSRGIDATRLQSNFDRIPVKLWLKSNQIPLAMATMDARTWCTRTLASELRLNFDRNSIEIQRRFDGTNTHKIQGLGYNSTVIDAKKIRRRMLAIQTHTSRKKTKLKINRHGYLFDFCGSDWPLSAFLASSYISYSTLFSLAVCSLALEQWGDQLVDIFLDPICIILLSLLFAFCFSNLAFQIYLFNVILCCYNKC